MFVGEFAARLDADRCVPLPPAFLEALAEPGDRRGLVALSQIPFSEPCVRLYTPSRWKHVEETLWKQTPSEELRLDVAFAEIGADGRLWLPERMVRSVLGPEVVLLGNLDWIEVWEREMFRLMVRDIEESEVVERARSLWSPEIWNVRD